MPIRTSPWKRDRINTRVREIRRVGVVRTGSSGSKVLPKRDMDLFESERPEARSVVYEGSLIRMACVCGAERGSFQVSRPRRKPTARERLLAGLGASLL